MTIKVAVVGLGKMGLSHLSILNALSDFEVVAVCDKSLVLGSVLEKYTGLRHFTDIKQVFAIPDLQAIVIATPTRAHESMVRKALERGLHVFCEKPLTLSSSASAEFADIAAAKGLVSQVGYHNRYVGTFAEMARLLTASAIGRVTHTLAEAYGPVVLRPTKPTWRSKPSEGGGCLYDYAAHPLNLLNWYFGRPESCASALLKSLFSAEVEDEVYATLRFGEGVTGEVSVNWSDPSVRKMTTQISIWGDGGKLYADRQEIHVFLTGNGPLPEGYEKGWTVRYITELTPPVSFYLRGEEYSAQIESFGRAIRNKAASNVNGFAQSADTDATIEMIRRAAAREEAHLPAQPIARRSGLIGRVFGR